MTSRPVPIFDGHNDALLRLWKRRNDPQVRRDPRVGVMIETGGQYSEFRAVMIRGHCEVIEDAAEAVGAVLGQLGAYVVDGSRHVLSLGLVPRRGERRDPLLSPLAQAADVGPVAEVGVLAGQAG